MAITYQDVVVFDRDDAAAAASQIEEVMASLRRLEYALHGSRDDDGRRLYAHVREALGSARVAAGILRGAM